MHELINLRDNYLVFSGDLNFINHSDFHTLINYVSSVKVDAFVT